MNIILRLSLWAAAASFSCFAFVALSDATPGAWYVPVARIGAVAWLIAALVGWMLTSPTRQRLPNLQSMIAGWMLPRPRTRRYANRQRRYYP